MACKKILIIQTSFIGDVVLATSLIVKLKACFPEASIDFLLKKGCEELLINDPAVNQVLILDKRKSRFLELIRLVKKIRATKYDLVVNVHRFLSSGLLTVLSGANETVGFDKNPMSFLYTKKLSHVIGDGSHEIVRNQQLIAHHTDHEASKPKLHLSKAVQQKLEAIKTTNYITISPSSVWYTKQLPKAQWIDFLNTSNYEGDIYLLGAKSDFATCEFIRKSLDKPLKALNMCGELSMLESAALMQTAAMNFMNDSAPLHFASAVNAPTTAVFCSTVPSFGFGPLADNSKIVEIKKKLACRPCGLHGFRTCPEKNFRCANEIDIQDLIDTLPASS
ncbi:MAG: glycosyltransferase family 9 protein [Cyclobacteriaceae bacterium]